jgi:hypothetical protein
MQVVIRQISGILALKGELSTKGTKEHEEEEEGRQYKPPSK